MMILLVPDASEKSGWRRSLVTEVPIGVPVVDGWTSLDLTSPLYRERGVVVRP